MALFDTDETKTKKASVKIEAKTSVLAARVLLRPRITEKAYALNALNQFVFQVVMSADKGDVRRAVEEAYGVKVTAVRMVRTQGKTKTAGRYTGKRSGMKKAIVELKKGDTIELFQAGI